MLEHVNRLGKDLERCTIGYNKFVGSLTRRVIVSARKFEELGITSKNDLHLSDANPVETTSRRLDIDAEPGP